MWGLRLCILAPLRNTRPLGVIENNYHLLAHILCTQCENRAMCSEIYGKLSYSICKTAVESYLDMQITAGQAHGEKFAYAPGERKTPGNKDKMLAYVYIFVISRCYCAQLTDPILVVMQNLGALGFKLTEERNFLDKHHLLVTMKKVGQFHGLSYAAKVNIIS